MTTPGFTVSQTILRCSPVYFFYFSFYGLFFPYLGRYLNTLGLDGQQIGLIMACVTGANLFAPFLLSHISDRTGRRVPLIRLCYLLMLVSYALTQLSSSFYWLLASFSLFGVFLSAVLPQMEGVVISQLGKQAEYYGRVRLWGSIGFVIAVWGIGSLLDVLPVTYLPMLGLVLIGVMLLATLPLADPAQPAAHAETGQAQANQSPVPWGPVAALLLSATLWQVGMAPYNTFFDLHLQANGYSGKTIGFLISLGTMAEILIFLFMVPIIKRLGSYWPFLLALALTAVRWLLIGYYPEQLSLLVIAQLLHAFTFGIIHSVCIYQVAHLFPASKLSLGQGLYVAMSMGSGLVLGNLIGGYNWSISPEQTFAFSAGITLCAMVIYAWFLRPKKSATLG